MTQLNKLRLAILKYLRGHKHTYKEGRTIWNNISSSHLIVLDIKTEPTHMYSELERLEKEGMIRSSNKKSNIRALIKWQLTPKGLSYYNKHIGLT